MGDSSSRDKWVNEQRIFSFEDANRFTIVKILMHSLTKVVPTSWENLCAVFELVKGISPAMLSVDALKLHLLF